MLKVIMKKLIQTGSSTNPYFVTRKGNCMIFVNNPIGLGMTTITTFVENKSLFGANDIVGASGPNFTLFTSDLPVTSLSLSATPFAICELQTMMTDEKPFWVIGFYLGKC